MAANEKELDITLENRLFEVHKKAGMPVRVMLGHPNEWSVAYHLKDNVTELVAPENAEIGFQNDFDISRGKTNVSAEYANGLAEATGVDVEKLVTHFSGSETNYIARGAVDIRALVVPANGTRPELTYTFIWPKDVQSKYTDGVFGNLQTPKQRVEQLREQGLIVGKFPLFFISEEKQKYSEVYSFLKDMIPEVVIADSFDATENLKRQFVSMGEKFAQGLSIIAKAAGAEIPAEAFLEDLGGRATQYLQTHTVSLHAIPIAEKKLSFFALAPSSSIMNKYKQN